MTFIKDLLKRMIGNNNLKKIWKRILTSSAAVVVFITIYCLILPAVAVDRDSTDEVAGMYLEDTGPGAEIVGNTDEALGADAFSENGSVQMLAADPSVENGTDEERLYAEEDDTLQEETFSDTTDPADTLTDAADPDPENDALYEEADWDAGFNDPGYDGSEVETAEEITEELPEESFEADGETEAAEGQSSDSDQQEAAYIEDDASGEAGYTADGETEENDSEEFETWGASSEEDAEVETASEEGSAIESASENGEAGVSEDGAQYLEEAEDAFSDNGEPELPEETGQDVEEAGNAESEADPDANLTELSAIFNDILVRVSFDSTTDIPYGSTMYLSEYDPQNSEEAEYYQHYVNLANQAVSTTETDWSLCGARLFAVRIEDPEGYGLQLTAPAIVQIEFPEAEPVHCGRMEVAQFAFDENGTEGAVLIPTVQESDVDGDVTVCSFETGDLSLFCVLWNDAETYYDSEFNTESNTDKNADAEIEVADEEIESEAAETEIPAEEAEAGAEAEEPESGSLTGRETEDTGLSDASESTEEADANELLADSEGKTDAYPAQTFSEKTETVKVQVYAGEGAFPAGTTMTVEDVVDEDTISAITDIVEKDVTRVHAVNITFFDADGNEIEPLKEIRVVMSAEESEKREEIHVVHVDDDGNAEPVADVTLTERNGVARAQILEQGNAAGDEAENDISEESATADGAAAQESEIADGTEESDALTEEVPEEAAVGEAESSEIGLVEDASADMVEEGEPAVEEDVAQDGADQNVVKQNDEAAFAAEEAEETEAAEENIPEEQGWDSAADFESVAAVEEEPATAEVSEEAGGIETADVASEDDAAIEVSGESADDIFNDEAADDGASVEFAANEFSVYALVYTVDFEYSVNGKMYQFSLPGGGFVSFTDLVEVLGIIGDTNSEENGDENGAVITENGEENGINEGAEEDGIDSDTNTALTLGDVEVSEATRKFVANVANVEFSSPELVDVSKVENETTVGQIKESRGLEVEYSAELTEEQIAEINAQTVEAGDWALISVQPFTSEETLTVTMKDGDQFVVRVTDAQISTHVITADGKDYIITVTYGSEAGIPDGAELTARELLPGTEEYEAHYTQMIAAVKGEVSDPDLDDEMNAAFAEAGLEVVNPQSAVEVAFARFFDISIWKDGAEIEPLTPVQVEIQYNEPVSVDSSAEAEVVHFAEDGIELIDPDTDLSESSGEGISSFTYQQSSFSISATLLKYTTGIQNGNYLIIKGAKDANKVEHWYALKADGSTVEVTKDGDTFTNTSNNADDAFWTFTSAGNGQYYIQNRSSWWNHLVLYDNIVGNWDQLINVEAPAGRKTVYLRNPNNTPLRFNGNTYKFVLGKQNDNAEQFFLARMTSEVPQGRGYNLTPAGETDLGDLNAWKDKVENSKIIVDKTASVVDYDNRMYQIDLKALSDITIIANKVDLELIVDTSRSMYFPANLSPVSGYYFTSIMGNDSHSLEKQLSWLDKNQIYYFIGNGEQATVYALYYAASGTNLNDYTGDQCWKFVDASYMNPPDAGSMNQSDRLNRLVGARIDDLAYNICNQNRDGGGCRLYTASSSITRLAYLKEAVRIASEIVYAVDKDNRIGLVTFNISAKDQGFYDYKNRTRLYGKINNISLAGGTRQDLGLETGKSQLDTNSRPDAEKIAILITDGAPNMRYDNNTQIPSDEAWRMIGEKATALKGTNSSNAKLYTLGLSLDMVGGNNQSHLNGLASEEDGVTRHFNASNGPEIVRAVKDLIDTLMYDVTLEAEVTDVLDPAFYPVDQNGNPIAAGDYTDDNGKRYNWSVVTVDGSQCWKITYYDQEVGRGEKNADNTIKTPGWQKSFYVKAKEDFLGGNNIETNRYKSSNNRVKPTKYVYKERGTNAIKKVNPPSNAPWGKFENTPTVNVDELHLNEHSTEWTVYLGTEVKPDDQVKALWDEIKVKQVVKTDGTANNGTTITSGDMKWYSKTDTVDTAAPNEGYSSLPINRYFTDADFNTLLNQLKTQDSAEKTINYTAYGHQPGTITVKLEKVIIEGAVDAKGKAPGQHITDKEGSPAEKYTITVTYMPNKTDTDCNVGHVTTGTGADEVKSTNEHKINVIKKGLQIEKRDKDSNDLIASPATFKLYRPAVISAGETGTALEGLSGSFFEVAALTTSGGISALDSQLPELRKLPEGQHYYLVETSEPKGYIKPMAPVQVDVSVSDGTETKPYEATEGITTLINKAAPAASVIITSDYAEEGEATNNTFVIKINNEAKTVDITIRKVDDKNTDLSGAIFKLINGPEIVPVSSSGTGVVVEPKVSGQTVTIKDNTFTIPAGGVAIKNLKVCDVEYEIVEVSPPAGYVIKNNTPARFKVTAGQITDEEHIAGVTYTSATNDFIIPNTPGAALPNTGGPGTTMIYLMGMLLTALAGAGFVLKNRKKTA